MNNSIKIDPFGFREYDARWLYPDNINLEGVTNLGKGLGTQIINHTNKSNPRIIVGHDYRSYSEEIKSALKKGLISTGCYVEDVGLALSPMVYFAQFNLESDAVAMVTASHNENGWTGVKMGIKKGLTHAPEEMKELKDITLNNNFTTGKGYENQIKNFDKIYKKDLINKKQLKKKIKAIVACGNGTAGIFAPDILRGIGCEVIELDCNLDWNFPKYNPNPEDLEMLHEIAKTVKENNADIGFGFDGDGDRIAAIDEKGRYSSTQDLLPYFISYLGEIKNNSYPVLKTVSGSDIIKNISESQNRDVFELPVGFKYIAEKMIKEKIFIGGEESGGVGFGDFMPERDALYAAMVLLNGIAEKSQYLYETLEEIQEDFGPSFYKRIDIKFPNQSEKNNVKEFIIDNIPENINNHKLKSISKIDGIKLRIDKNFWLLFRFSGTEPLLRLYCEAPKESYLIEVLEWGQEFINLAGK